MRLDLRDFARAQNVEKSAGAIERDDPIGDLREVLRRVSRPASDIDDRVASVELRAAPGVERARPPNGVLQAQPRHLVVVSA